MVRMENISLEQIKLDTMKEPRVQKLEYYENYYLQHHMFAHGITIDENNQILHGYTTYLLAKKYSVKDVPVLKTESSKKLYKIVVCKHITCNENGIYRISCKKEYMWRYNGRRPVVPGDVLLTEGLKNRSLVVVERVVISDEDCGHKAIHKHIRRTSH